VPTTSRLKVAATATVGALVGAAVGGEALFPVELLVRRPGPAVCTTVPARMLPWPRDSFVVAPSSSCLMAGRGWPSWLLAAAMGLGALSALVVLVLWRRARDSTARGGAEIAPPGDEPRREGWLLAEHQARWRSRAAVACGIAGLLAAITVVGGLALGLAAVLLGRAGQTAARRAASGQRVSAAGVGLGAAALLLSALTAGGYVAAVVQLQHRAHSLNRCVMATGGDPQALQRCAQRSA
jgi:hypothetical protein